MPECDEVIPAATFPNMGVAPLPAKKARKPRAAKVKREAKPRKAAARMRSFIGTWCGSTETNDLRFVVECECSPDGVRGAAAVLDPACYDTITGRVGSVTVEEKRRKAVTLG